MAKRAKGMFDVELSPEASDESDGVTVGRMKIEKTYDGDLTGTAKGEMLTAVCEAGGSAGYVAVERVVGVLHGRKGSFVLQHSGTMTHEGQSVRIGVVPGSGTGALLGMSGELTITIKNGEHSYLLEYSLPRTKSR